MTSAEIYNIIAEMLMDCVKHPYTMNAVYMHVYSACAFYPQEDSWYIAHMGAGAPPIQCVP